MRKMNLMDMLTEIEKIAMLTAMMKNKEILHNMIKIAKEVGIKVTASAFDEIKESDETDNLETERMSVPDPIPQVSNELPHGHTVNGDRDDSHRHRLIRKMRGI